MDLPAFSWTMGELTILERLLILSENDVQRERAISAWKSTGPHCSDFVFRNACEAIDAKDFTLKTQRNHTVSSVDQVSGSPGWVTSISIVARPVSDDEGHSMADLIQRIRHRLENASLVEFNRKIDSLE